ncbi:MAG: glycosyltransferase family 4 protein [Myxococcales bacterium]|nr:glycosyltransferase family 4 protein [Myxococcales bacterium]
MRVLQLFSNYKWTGPAEPAFLLARGLRARGVDVHFAAMPPIAGEVDAFGPRCAAAAVPFHRGLHLEKHFSLRRNWRDVPRLAALIDAIGADVVHAHLGNDHLLAALAGPRSRGKPVLIRSHHGGEPLRRDPRARWLAGARTQGWIEVSERALEGDRRGLGIPAERSWRVDPPLDLARFDPARRLENPRARWGFPPGAFLVGIAARVQRHRRFDLLLEGLRRAGREASEIRLVIIGRGTHLDALARAPAEAMGLGEIVRFAGYLEGDDYVAALAALDAAVLLVPGTDGGCRALREAMAMAKPVVATRRGMIPELIVDGRTGRLVDEDVDALAGALVDLARDSSSARSLGEAARREAARRFDPDRHAAVVERIYETLLKGGR